MLSKSLRRIPLVFRAAGLLLLVALVGGQVWQRQTEGKATKILLAAVVRRCPSAAFHGANPTVGDGARTVDRASLRLIADWLVPRTSPRCGHATVLSVARQAGHPTCGRTVITGKAGDVGAACAVTASNEERHRDREIIAKDEIGTATLHRKLRWNYDMSNEVATDCVMESKDAIGADTSIPDPVMRVMEALTSLMVGDKGDARGAAFNREMMVIVGAPLPSEGLIWLASLARLNRKHVVHLSLAPNPGIPSVAFAYRKGQRVEVYENCMLCLDAEQDRVLIVPDSFRAGAFQLGPTMTLRRKPAPMSFDAATDSMVRAYRKFDDILTVEPADD